MATNASLSDIRQGIDIVLRCRSVELSTYFCLLPGLAVPTSCRTCLVTSQGSTLVKTPRSLTASCSSRRAGSGPCQRLASGSASKAMTHRWVLWLPPLLQLLANKYMVPCVLPLVVLLVAGDAHSCCCYLGTCSSATAEPLHSHFAFIAPAAGPWGCAGELLLQGQRPAYLLQGRQRHPAQCAAVQCHC